MSTTRSRERIGRLSHASSLNGIRSATNAKTTDVLFNSTGLLQPEGNEGSDGGDMASELGEGSANNPYHWEMSVSRTHLVSLWIVVLVTLAFITGCCCWRFEKIRAAGRFQ